jgi:hypothetical protein
MHLGPAKKLLSYALCLVLWSYNDLKILNVVCNTAALVNPWCHFLAGRFHMHIRSLSNTAAIHRPFVIMFLHIYYSAFISNTHTHLILLLKLVLIPFH